MEVTIVSRLSNAVRKNEAAGGMGVFCILRCRHCYELTRVYTVLPEV